MRATVRWMASILIGLAVLLWVSRSPTPQGHARPCALLDWVTVSGEVSYSDGAGCYCTNVSVGECSIQFDKNGRSIGSCDDTDSTCGDITACPH